MSAAGQSDIRLLETENLAVVRSPQQVRCILRKARILRKALTVTMTTIEHDGMVPTDGHVSKSEPRQAPEGRTTHFRAPIFAARF